MVNLQQWTEFQGRLDTGHSALLPQSLLDKVIRDLIGTGELCDLEGHTDAVRGSSRGRLQCRQQSHRTLLVVGHPEEDSGDCIKSDLKVKFLFH